MKFYFLSFLSLVLTGFLAASPNDWFHFTSILTK